MQIALLGAAPSSRKLAPFQDLNWEIWACSPPNYDLPRVDAWFEFHSLERKMTQNNQPFISVLQRHSRVYLNHEDPMAGHFPDSIDFPFEMLIEKHGQYFWTSSLAWMFAFALEFKPKVIGLWGVDMSAAEEYGYQRAGMHHFVQKADDMGIRVIAPPQSDILNPIPMYGLKEQSPMWWKQRVRRQELQDRIAHAESLVATKKNEITILRGALDDMNYIDNTYCPTMFRYGKEIRKPTGIPHVQAIQGATLNVPVSGLQDLNGGSQADRSKNGFGDRAGDFNAGPDRSGIGKDSDAGARSGVVSDSKGEVQAIPASDGGKILGRAKGKSRGSRKPTI